MKKVFTNTTSVPIPADGTPTVASQINVADMHGCLRDVNITIDIDHSWTSDLRITLIAPTGDSVLLVEREGGNGNNFRNTTFDDAASRSIVGQIAPFGGAYQPLESLAAFDGIDLNGDWTLQIEDRADADGGQLNSWTLELDDGCFFFENATPVTIDASGPNRVESQIEVTDLGGAVIDVLYVHVDIDHTWDNDLTITLISPDGTVVVLVERRGGRGDNFRNTVFSDFAETNITDASPPFTGTFQPEQALEDFQEGLAVGTWTLRVEDSVSFDGGALNSWGLEMQTRCAMPRTATNYSIDVRFAGGLTPSQRSVFELAAARWSEIIVGDLPDVAIGGEVIDDLLIIAEGKHIDGAGSILGQAGPTHIRPDTNLPARGIMSFDSADLASMEQDGTLINVIIHEMGHVIGIGTIWNDFKLLSGQGTTDPVFNGSGAIGEYETLRGASDSAPVPVANTGGPGTREGHWRELTFGNELMTGFINAGNNPLSRMTIASLQDMGYQVNINAADPFNLPTPGLVSLLMAEPHYECHTTSPKPEVIPEEDIV